MWKYLGAFIGLMVSGPLGAVVGFFFGWFYQQSALARPSVLGPFGNLEGKRKQYFHSTFRLMGHIAKVDGRVSEEEIQLAESLMQRMKLSAEHKREAIQEFKNGAAADFDLEAELQLFVQRCGQRGNLSNMLLVTLISTALADQEIDQAEHQALTHIAQALGFSAAQFEQLLGMIAAQQGFSANSEGRQQGNGARGPVDSLKQAYVALGVEPEVDDKALKRAYRKLISKHHPDKLIAQGVPDDMVAVATEKAQEIQAAYDMIDKYRKSQRA